MGKKMKKGSFVSNKNIRSDLNDEDLKTLGEIFQRLGSLQSIDLNFERCAIFIR